MIELSKDQKSALDDMLTWWKFHAKDPSSNCITLGSRAGTGKTTLITIFRNELSPSVNVGFCALTGKAALVLDRKLKSDENYMGFDDFIGTIHKLAYYPIVDEDTGEIQEWVKRNTLDYDLIIIDEASMVSEPIFKDLRSYGIPILAVGDHCQLPPIEGSFNLMDDPILKLETQHRFLGNSDLIRVSLMALNEGKIPDGEYGHYIKKMKMGIIREEEVLKFVRSNNILGGDDECVVICGMNKTRIDLNNKIREMFGFGGKNLAAGERVICLKNNYKSNVPIYNGVQGTVVRAKQDRGGDFIRAEIKIDGETIANYKGKISTNTFNNPKPDFWKDPKQRKVDHFDFGEVITCHKSQGSEWQSVLLLCEGRHVWGSDWNRWLYTAVTRSSKNLLIIE